MPALLTTQNRKGMGAIVPGVQELADAEPLDKVSFGCMGDDGFRAKLAATAPPGATLLLTGVETRTSSPLKIGRGENLQSLNTPGLYPAGEGASYAGGILSAGVDGIKVGEAVARSLLGIAA